MREAVEGVRLEGRTVRVTLRHGLSVAPRTLALAMGIRVFERYAILDRLALTVAESEVEVSRAEVELGLGPEGLAVARDRERYREILTQALAERPPAAPTPGPAGGPAPGPEPAPA